MLLLLQSFDAIAANLALDEALLETAEAVGPGAEILRVWESPVPAVIIGRSSDLVQEVNVNDCRANGVPILRRASGGAAVVVGPGCLMYALVLSYQRRPELRMVDRAHRFVLEQFASALAALAPGAARAGTSDLAIAGQKFSGNSVRCKRTHFLYHGTVLYDMRLKWIDEYLLTPPRQPAYREGRAHRQFVRNFPATREQIEAAIIGAFAPRERMEPWTPQALAALVNAKYACEAWNQLGRTPTAAPVRKPQSA